MKSLSPYFLAPLLLVGSALATEPAPSDAAQGRIQTEQKQKQALANALWRYLAGEAGRKRQLDEASNRLYDLALRDGTSADQPSTVLLTQWLETLAPLHPLAVPATAKISLLRLEASLKEAHRLLSTLPPAAVPGEPADMGKQAMRSLERRQALLNTATALLGLKQNAQNVDAQLDEEARRADSAAQVLSGQMLMLPATTGEKK